MQTLIMMKGNKYTQQYIPRSYFSRSFQVTNIATQAISYKIRTTNPKMYQVKPYIGCLQPGNAVTIDVTTTVPFVWNDIKINKQQDSADIKDKFQILTTLIDDVDGDLSNYWKTLDKDLISTINLKTKLQKPASSSGTFMGSFMDPIHEVDEPYSSQNINNSADAMYQSICQPIRQEVSAFTATVPAVAEVASKEPSIGYYHAENQKLMKEISDLKIAYQSVVSQKQLNQIGASVMQGDGQFSMLQLLVVLVIALVLGALLGNR